MIDARDTLEEIGRRAKEIYQENIRPAVEAENTGKYVTIDVDSGDWEIGTEVLETTDALRDRHPDGRFFTLRVGYPAASRMGIRGIRTGGE